MSSPETRPIEIANFATDKEAEPAPEIAEVAEQNNPGQELLHDPEAFIEKYFV